MLAAKVKKTQIDPAMKITIFTLRRIAANPSLASKYAIKFLGFDCALSSPWFWRDRLIWDDKNKNFRTQEQINALLDKWKKDYKISRQFSKTSESFFFEPLDGSGRKICAVQTGGENGQVNFFEVKKTQIQVDSFSLIH